MPPDLPLPVLEVFYSPTCAPCRLELPAVAEMANGKDLRVHIVILDQEERARFELSAVSPRLDTLATVSRPAVPGGDVLRAAGDKQGILPYARSITADGETCATWSGGLTVARAKSLIDACARVISPRRSRS